MVKGKIIYNKKDDVWHISGWGHSFETKAKAIRFKKLTSSKNSLEKTLDMINNKLKNLNI